MLYAMFEVLGYGFGVMLLIGLVCLFVKLLGGMIGSTARSINNAVDGFKDGYHKAKGDCNRC